VSSSPIAGHSRTDECLCPIWQRGEGQRPGPPATHPFPHRPQVVRGRQPAGPTSSAVLRHHPGGRVVPASRRCTPGPRHRTSAQTRSGRGGRANGLPAAAFPGPPLRIHLAGRQRGWSGRGRAYMPPHGRAESPSHRHRQAPCTRNRTAGRGAGWSFLLPPGRGCEQLLVRCAKVSAGELE